MGYFVLIIDYFAWHYTRAFRDMFGVYRNYLWFFYNYFSVGILLKTLFAPWKRLSRDESADASPFTDFIVSTLMRLVGLIVRLVTIFIGLSSVLGLTLVLFIALFVWLFMPILVVFFLLLSINELIQQ